MTRIVVGVDGSGHARAALRWALDEARLRRADVLAVHTYRPAMASLDVPRTYIDLHPAARAMLADEVAKALAGAGVEVTVEQHVADADAGATLVRLARPGDLVVVGSRGHGVVASTILGSTSHYVACHAPCPVVIVKEARP